MRVKKSIINEGQIPISSCYATRVRAEGCHKTPRSALPKERSRLCACEERRVKHHKQSTQPSPAIAAMRDGAGTEPMNRAVHHDGAHSEKRGATEFQRSGCRAAGMKSCLRFAACECDEQYVCVEASAVTLRIELLDVCNSSVDAPLS